MKTILKALFFAMAFVISGVAASNELGKADRLYDRGQYKKALAIYLKHPKNPLVQNRIGTIYLKPGLKDSRQSTEWFRKAADQNNVDGIFNLALAYDEGIGVKKDYAQAYQLYKKAADLGLSDAMNSLGILYEQGLGVKKSEKEAAKWYAKAADEGNTIAQCNLAGYHVHGTISAKHYEKALDLLNQCLKSDPGNDCCLDRMAELYSFGWGVPQDNQKAHGLREKAAAHGSAVAMYNLGRDFDYGIGAPKDPKAALDWYLKAAGKTHAKAMYRLYEVYEYGKLGQTVDKAKAGEWKAKAEKAMKAQGLSRHALADSMRLTMEWE